MPKRFFKARLSSGCERQVRQGVPWRGKERRVEAWQARQGLARHGEARSGKAGQARRGSEWQGVTGHG